MDGDQVIQVYARDIESLLPQLIKTLQEFKRVHIKAGESRTVEIPLAVGNLGYYDEQKGDFVVEPGTFEIQAGVSSADIQLTTLLEVR